MLFNFLNMRYSNIYSKVSLGKALGLLYQEVDIGRLDWWRSSFIAETSAINELDHGGTVYLVELLGKPKPRNIGIGMAVISSGREFKSLSVGVLPTFGLVVLDAGYLLLLAKIPGHNQSFDVSNFDYVHITPPTTTEGQSKRIR